MDDEYLEYKNAQMQFENLQHLLKDYRYMFNDDLINATEIAIHVIKKQIPKRLLMTNLGEICPNCHNLIEKTPYCSICGQRLTSE